MKFINDKFSDMEDAIGIKLLFLTFSENGTLVQQPTVISLEPPF
jgi:hypothetical protein